MRRVAISHAAINGSPIELEQAFLLEGDDDGTISHAAVVQSLVSGRPAVEQSVAITGLPTALIGVLAARPLGGALRLPISVVLPVATETGIAAFTLKGVVVRLTETEPPRDAYGERTADHGPIVVSVASEQDRGGWQFLPVDYPAQMSEAAELAQPTSLSASRRVELLEEAVRGLEGIRRVVYRIRDSGCDPLSDALLEGLLVEVDRLGDEIDSLVSQHDIQVELQGDAPPWSLTTSFFTAVVTVLTERGIDSLPATTRELADFLQLVVRQLEWAVA